MRVLVAGGAGFVGSHLCRALIDGGHEVACVDDLSSGRITNVSDLMTHEGFKFYEADVTRRRWDYGTLPEPPDVVVHLASPASPVDYDRRPLATLAANSFGTDNLLRIALNARARFIYASTSEVYGDPLVHPQPESYFGNVDPVGPRSCYDEGKRFGEALVTVFRQEFGTQAAIMRIFNTYGPSMRLDDGRVIPAFLSAALSGRPMPVHGDGRQTRSYMYVADLVAALLHVAMDQNLDGLVANVGNPEESTVIDLAWRVLAITGRNELGVEYLPARPGDPRQRRPDITRMRERYGWSPTVTLSEGLLKTVAWARSQEEGQ